MSWYEILIIVASCAFVVGVAAMQVVRKKKGKSGCDCCRDCSACSACSSTKPSPSKRGETEK
ncbi:MAG: FeoB-associated Cys-rich membrane protein [Candidatus Gallimonas sp.]